jgi:hypothetical protein
MSVLLPTIGAALAERHWFWGCSPACCRRCGYEPDLIALVALVPAASTVLLRSCALPRPVADEMQIVGDSTAAVSPPARRPFEITPLWFRGGSWID